VQHSLDGMFGSPPRRHPEAPRFLQRGEGSRVVPARNASARSARNIPPPEERLPSGWRSEGM